MFIIIVSKPYLAPIFSQATVSFAVPRLNFPGDTIRLLYLLLGQFVHIVRHIVQILVVRALLPLELIVWHLIIATPFEVVQRYLWTLVVVTGRAAGHPGLGRLLEDFGVHDCACTHCILLQIFVLKEVECVISSITTF